MTLSDGRFRILTRRCPKDIASPEIEGTTQSGDDVSGIVSGTFDNVYNVRQQYIDTIWDPIAMPIQPYSHLIKDNTEGSVTCN